MNFPLVLPFLQLQSAVNRWEPCELHRFEAGATSCRLSATDSCSRWVMLRESLVQSLQEAWRRKWWPVDFHRNNSLPSDSRCSCAGFFPPSDSSVDSFQSVCSIIFAYRSSAPSFFAWRSWFSAGILCWFKSSIAVIYKIFYFKKPKPLPPHQVRWHPSALRAHHMTCKCDKCFQGSFAPPESPFTESQFLSVELNGR